MSRKGENNAPCKRATLAGAILEGTVKGDVVECANCGKSFEQRRRDHLFCSEQCRYQDWSKRHPRIAIGKGFKIIPNEPGGKPAPAKKTA